MFRKIKEGDIVEVTQHKTRVIVREVDKKNEDTLNWYREYWEDKGVEIEEDFDTIVGVSFPTSPNKIYGFPKPLVKKKWFQFYHKADLKSKYNLEEW